jgi:hypothetical protein
LAKQHIHIQYVFDASLIIMLFDPAGQPASLHTYSVALEDGAFIGKIFSHSQNRDRIPQFLHAFQEHRYVSLVAYCL